MEFIVELLKEMAKGIIREDMRIFQKAILDKENENNEKPTLDRKVEKVGFIKKK